MLDSHAAPAGELRLQCAFPVRALHRTGGHQMMRNALLRSLIVGHALLLVLLGCAGTGAQQSGGVQRLYVFNCGESTVEDISRWTPGVNVGRPGGFSANCYLVQHANGLMLWDSGINDGVASMPEGFQRSKVSPRYTLRKAFSAQLAVLDIEPAQIGHVAFSHTHGDHVGNANLSTVGTLYIQHAEYKAQSDGIPKAPAYID
jgi:hypothetical protein